MTDSFSQSLRKYNLLNHPFYKAWNDGKLSGEQLAVYADQYGQFIQLISKGWQTAGEEVIAAEEQHHYVLWQNFTNSLQHHKKEVSLPAVSELITSTKTAYNGYATALGALYAFEAQQPAATSSKLHGLRTHYSDWHVDEIYFKVHADDIDEPQLLLEKIGRLSDQDVEVASQACENTCKLLWNALSEIYEAA